MADIRHIMGFIVITNEVKVLTNSYKSAFMHKIILGIFYIFFLTHINVLETQAYSIIRAAPREYEACLDLLK